MNIDYYQKFLKKFLHNGGKLSLEENKVVKIWICQTIAGIRDRNYLIALIDNLHKRRNLIW